MAERIPCAADVMGAAFYCLAGAFLGGGLYGH